MPRGIPKNKKPVVPVGDDFEPETVKKVESKEPTLEEKLYKLKIGEVMEVGREQIKGGIEVTVVLKVPNGLIYKFYHTDIFGNNPNIMATTFVPLAIS